MTQRAISSCVDESDFFLVIVIVDEEIILESEHYEDEGKENTNWVNEDCSDVQEERKFIVFQSKVEKLLHVLFVVENVQAAKLTSKG